MGISKVVIKVDWILGCIFWVLINMYLRLQLILWLNVENYLVLLKLFLQSFVLFTLRLQILFQLCDSLLAFLQTLFVGFLCNFERCQQFRYLNRLYLCIIRQFFAFIFFSLQGLFQVLLLKLRFCQSLFQFYYLIFLLKYGLFHSLELSQGNLHSILFFPEGKGNHFLFFLDPIDAVKFEKTILKYYFIEATKELGIYILRIVDYILELLVTVHKLLVNHQTVPCKAKTLIHINQE